MRKGGCVRAYVRGVRTWAWPGRVLARVRAHVFTRVRAPELTNIPLHMRRRLQYAGAAGEIFLGRAERQRWGLELAGTLVRGDRSVRPSVRPIWHYARCVDVWARGCVGAWVCGTVSCVGDSGYVSVSRNSWLSYNKVHQGKWPCAARQIFFVEAQHHSKGGGSAIRCFVI